MLTLSKHWKSKKLLMIAVSARSGSINLTAME